jgi:hypothetical protein
MVEEEEVVTSETIDNLVHSCFDGTLIGAEIQVD